jgi:hypothetical protein
VTDAEREQTLEAIELLKSALRALRTDPRTTAAYELLAEGPLDEIAKLSATLA